MKKLYGAFDLHSSNNYLGISDEKDRRVYKKKLPNQADVILAELEPYRNELVGIVVESTFNWYWLVDGLMENGYKVHLVNTAAVKQYEGLKHTDDESDAFWLAHLLRLGILPTALFILKKHGPYEIYPESVDNSFGNVQRIF